MAQRHFKKPDARPIISGGTEYMIAIWKEMGYVEITEAEVLKIQKEERDAQNIVRDAAIAKNKKEKIDKLKGVGFSDEQIAVLDEVFLSFNR